MYSRKSQLSLNFKGPFREEEKIWFPAVVPWSLVSGQSGGGGRLAFDQYTTVICNQAKNNFSAVFCILVLPMFCRRESCANCENIRGWEVSLTIHLYRDHTYCSMLGNHSKSLPCKVVKKLSGKNRRIFLHKICTKEDKFILLMLHQLGKLYWVM